MGADARRRAQELFINCQHVEDDQGVLRAVCMDCLADALAQAVKERDGWQETARLYAQNTDHWSKKSEQQAEEITRLREAVRERDEEIAMLKEGFTKDGASAAELCCAEIKAQQAEEIARLHRLLGAVNPCSFLCPSVWKTGEPQPHTAICREVTETLHALDRKNSA